MAWPTIRFMTFKEWIAANPDVHDIEGTCLECNRDCNYENFDVCPTTKTGRHVILTCEEQYEAQLNRDKALATKMGLKEAP